MYYSSIPKQSDFDSHSLVNELFALPSLGYDGLQHAVSQGNDQVLALPCLVGVNNNKVD